MSTPSPKGIIQDGLLFHTDLANPATRPGKVFNLTGFTNTPEVIGLPTDNKSVVQEVYLDFGLTEYETGRAQSIYDSGLKSTAGGLKLSQIGYPRENTERINDAIDPKAGAYIDFGDSYLQGYFKLEGYDWELLPKRYSHGVTLETSLLVTEDTFLQNNNIFLFLGCRSENKFYKSFIAPESTTSSGIPLAPDHENEPELGVEGNAIGFMFDSRGRIGYRTINDDLEIIEEFSTNTLTRTGWVNISLAYQPCDDITDSDLLECAARRGGVLRVVVNGVLFHEFHGFQEFMFKGLETQKEKQIGVPYTISWGGGTKGLGYPSFALSLFETQKIFDVELLLLEKHFNHKFRGGAQTLRIYDRPLSVLEARHNHNVLAPRYTLPLIKGGRVTPNIAW